MMGYDLKNKSAVSDRHGRSKDMPVFVAVLAAGALAAMCINFFPSSNAAYVICPWIYLPLFLYACRIMTGPVQSVLWFLFWFVSFIIRYRGILEPFSVWMSLALQFAAAAVYSLPFWIDRFVYRRGGGIASLFVFPFVYVSIDYILELLSLGSLFSLAQTQFDNKPLLQLAAVLGCKGIVFVLALSASFLVHYRKNLKGIVICLSVIFAIHLCGALRISICAPSIQNADRLVIGWSAEPVYDDSFFSEGYGGDLDMHVKCLFRAVSEAADKGVGLLCFPEETFFIKKEDRGTFINKAQELAAEYRINLLLSIESGSAYDGKEKGVNQCIMIDSDGTVREDYHKTMLVPVAEEPYYEKGQGELPSITIRVDGRDLNISYAICFDGDFASYIRKAPDNTDLFINVSWDWDQVDELHYRIIGQRAVENGFTILKPTVCGYTTVTDYLGNIHSKTHSADTGYAGVKTVVIPLAGCDTIYHVLGDIIDIMYIIGAALFFVLSVRKRRA